MKKILMFITLCLFLYKSLKAQNIFPSSGAVGIGTTSPNASSLFEIKSTTKGLLTSRMTQAQRNAITSPATGLLIYQTNPTPGFYYYTGSAWKAVTPKTGWSLTGNAGTVPGTNFLGTTDAKALMFKVNNVKAGFLGTNGNIFWGQGSGNNNTNGYSNVAIGVSALYKNTTRSNLVAIGDSALYNNGTGAVNSFDASYNTAIGSKALFANTTGYSNTAAGYYALNSNETGVQNTAIGTAALQHNTVGTNNTAISPYALFKNITGENNIAVGEQSLSSNTTGSNNAAIGFFSLGFNLTGFSNVAVGTKALYNNTDRSNLVAIGDSALYNNGTGAVNSFDATYNTAIGSKALYSNTTGSHNTANGVRALYSNKEGDYNTANGSQALYSNTTGIDNTAVGYNSLKANISGLRNTAVGSNTLLQNTAWNNTAIGSYALQFNKDGTGNVAVGTGSLSSNISGNNNTAMGLNSLNANLTGESNTALGYFALGNNTGGANVAVGHNALQTNTSGVANTGLGYYADASTGNLTNATALGANAIVNANNKIRLGDGGITVVESNGVWTTSDGRFKNNIKDNVKGLEFIKLLKPVTYNFDTKKFSVFLMQNYPDSVKQKRLAAMDKEATAKASSVVQSGFVAQDVAEAVKRSGYNFNGVHAPENPTDNWSISYEKLVVPLVKAVQELSKMNDDKDAKINALETRLSKMEEQLKINPSSVSFTDATLGQNIPNPFTNSTAINYTIPQKYTSAQILITDKNGKVLKAVTISGSDKGSLKVNASTLASGAYQYSLIIDGKLIATKQMAIIK